MASIRGLGRIATSGAREALEETAASHPDPDTRRRARAEATLLARIDDEIGDRVEPGPVYDLGETIVKGPGDLYGNLGVLGLTNTHITLL